MNKKKSPLKHTGNHFVPQSFSSEEEYHKHHGGVHGDVDYDQLLKDQNDPKKIPPPVWDTTGAKNLFEYQQQNKDQKTPRYLRRPLTYTYMWDAPGAAVSKADKELVQTYLKNQQEEQAIGQTNLRKERDKKIKGEDLYSREEFKGTPERRLNYHRSNDPFYIGGSFNHNGVKWVKEGDNNWYQEVTEQMAKDLKNGWDVADYKGDALNKDIESGDKIPIDQLEFYDNIFGEFREDDPALIKDTDYKVGDYDKYVFPSDTLTRETQRRLDSIAYNQTPQEFYTDTDQYDPLKGPLKPISEYPEINSFQLDPYAGFSEVYQPQADAINRAQIENQQQYARHGGEISQAEMQLSGYHTGLQYEPGQGEGGDASFQSPHIGIETYEDAVLMDMISTNFNVDIENLNDVVVYDNIVMIEHENFKHDPAESQITGTGSLYSPQYMIINDEWPTGKIIREDEVPDDFFAAENLKRKNEYFNKAHGKSGNEFITGEHSEHEFGPKSSKATFSKGYPTVKDAKLMHITTNMMKQVKGSGSELSGEEWPTYYMETRPVNWHSADDVVRVLKENYGYVSGGKYDIRVKKQNDDSFTLYAKRQINGQEVVEEEIIRLKDASGDRELKYIFQDIRQFTKKWAKGAKQFELIRDKVDREAAVHRYEASYLNTPGARDTYGNLTRYGEALEREHYAKNAIALGYEDYRPAYQIEADRETIRLGGLENIRDQDGILDGSGEVTYRFIRKRETKNRIKQLESNLENINEALENIGNVDSLEAQKQVLERISGVDLDIDITTETPEKIRELLEKRKRKKEKELEKLNNILKIPHNKIGSLQLNSKMEAVLTNLQSYSNPEGKSGKLIGISLGDTGDDRNLLYKVTEAHGDGSLQIELSDELFTQIMKDLTQSDINHLYARSMTPSEKEAIYSNAINKVLKNRVSNIRETMGGLDKEVQELHAAQTELENQEEIITATSIDLDKVLVPIDARRKLHNDNIEKYQKEGEELLETLESLQNNEDASEKDYNILVDKYNRILDLQKEEINNYNKAHKERMDFFNTPEVKALIKNTDELAELQLELTTRGKAIEGYFNKFNEQYQEAMEMYGWDSNEKRFDSAFDETDKYKEWQNELNPWVSGTLATMEAFWDAGTSYTIGTGFEIGAWLLDKTGVSDYDSWSTEYKMKVLDNYIERDQFGQVGEDQPVWEGLTSGDGASMYRSFGQGLPYILMMINEGKKGDMQGLSKHLAKFTGLTKLKNTAEGAKRYRDISSKVNMANASWKMTLHDNASYARNELGLKGGEAFAYANVMSVITALSQSIMPDSKFITGKHYKSFQKDLASALKGKANWVASEQAVKSVITNYFKELGEEEIEFVSQQIVTMSWLGTDSEALTDIRNHQEILAGTTVMVAPFSAYGGVKRFKYTKEYLNSTISIKGDEILRNMEERTKDLNSKLSRYENLSNPPENTIRNIKERLAELDKMKEYAQTLKTAVKKSKEKSFAPGPKDVEPEPSPQQTQEKTEEEKQEDPGSSTKGGGGARYGGGGIYAKSFLAGASVQQNPNVSKRRRNTNKVDQKIDGEYVEMLENLEKLILEKNKPDASVDENLNKQINDLKKKIESHEAYKEYEGEVLSDVEHLKRNVEETSDNVDVIVTETKEESAEVMEETLLNQREELDLELENVSEEDYHNQENIEKRLKRDEIDRTLRDVNRIQDETSSNAEAQTKESVLIDSLEDYIAENTERAEKEVEEAERKRRERKKGRKELSKDQFDQKVRNKLEREFLNSNEATINIGADMYSPKDLYENINSLKIPLQRSQTGGAFFSNGYITPEVNGRSQIIINKAQAMRSGYVTTGQHEFLHYALRETMKNSPEIKRALGSALMDYINNNRKNITGGSEFERRLQVYYNDPDAAWEETLPLLSEAMSRGDIKENRGVVTKFRDAVRQWKQQSGGAHIHFNKNEDVFNFIKDYNKSFRSGVKNEAFIKMVKEGATGNLITKAKTRRENTKFSQGVKNTFLKFPDMKRDFDKNTISLDGYKMWGSKAEYQDSPEYWDGFMEIMDSKGLTSLIKQGVKSQTGIESPQELEDFVNKVKEKLTKRYEKNFDPTKANGSLFGWLVGGGGDYTKSTLYRAKGDVMNEYKKQIRAESIDKETARADQLQNQADESLEAFENQDITKERIKPVKGIKLHERLGPKAIAINEEVKTIASTMDVSNLNFKKLQDLTPDMTQDMFGIKPKPGNLTKVDVKNAQMFINKHADVLLAMLPKGSTASGTSTGVQKVLLDAFYTKSDRTKMAKTGSAAGLAVQVKNDNITTKQFLEVFGITERGEPNLYKKDTNTSSRVKALVAQTGRMLTNQGVREHLIERQESLNTVQRIADGKSDVMFSMPEQRNFNLAKKVIDDFPSLRSEFDLGVRGVDELLSIYQLDKVHNFKTKKDIDNFYSKIENVVIPILPKGFITKSFLRPSRRILPNKGKDIIKVNGKETTIDQYYTQKRDELFLTDKQRKAKGLKPIKYGKDFTGKGKDFKSRVYGTYLGKTPNEIEKSNNEGKIKEFNEINSSMHQQLWARINESIRSNPMNATIWGNYFKTVGQMSTHPHRLGAEMIGWSPKPIGRIVKGKRRLYEWEHAMPATSAYLYLLDASLSGGNFDVSYDLVMKNFKLIALDAGADLKLKAANLTTGMPKGWDLIENSWWQRYFNKEVGSQIGEDGTIGIDPTSIKTIDGSDLGTQLNINKDGDAAFVTPGSTTASMFSKAVENSRLINHKTSPRGMSAFDFDETLIDKGENTITAKKGDDVIEITSAEWPIEGPKLAKAGYEFDFSDFINVRGGVEGPLMQKFRNRIDKYGIENNYILTARPPESAPAIQAWLAQQGIDMPIENITGLGNSTGEAKAIWIANKFAEGYNDVYFVDDALPNVKAVKNVMDQLDIKGSSVQAKVQFSKNMDKSFNDILEQTTGVESQKQFSEAQAKLRGKKGRYKGLIPASAQDFMGLLYNFMGKGKVGEQQMEFFKKALVDPFARGVNELNAAKQTSFNDLNNLFKQFKGIKKKLRKKVKDTNFTVDQATRVYLWNKAGFKVPGLSKRDAKTLVDYINKNEELKAFADALGIISKKDQGYSEPGEYWLAENIQSDILSDGALGDARSKYLEEWQQNVDEIFSPKNLNKIQAIYGAKFTEALKDILYRMKTGSNRPTGSNRLTNMYMNWVNNSVGAIMFFNIRSATLQTISAVNYVNWSDNNPLKAGAAFANQPQFWKDFAFLFNSDFLKQRRKGNQRGVNESELLNAVVGSNNPAKAAIAWLLNKGFLPTQIADSFAIASGGATFYRNRVNKYKKQGMDQRAAEEQAFLDFQETTEVSQQSARPDLISQQQANPLGRLILAFQNTPMQYGRIMNKAIRDLVNRRGDVKTHLSKIVYYGAVQAIIFNALQSAIWASLADEDDEEIDKKKFRILNGMVDGWLSAFGYGGKAVSTVSNTVQEYLKQRDRGFQADHTYTILRLLSFSPPIGSKARKIYSSIQTEKFNEDIMKERGFTLDNPIWSAIGNTIEGFTNIPLGRLSNKMLNLDNAMDSNNEYWKRIALVMGWNTWDLNIKDPDLETLKLEIKEQKKQEKLLEKEEAKQDKLREKYPDKTDEEIKETLLVEEKTKQVFDLNKREQVKILEGLELNPKDYPKEQDRVNIIMDIYNKDPEMIDSTLSAVENYVPSKQEKRSIDLFKTSKKDQVNMLMDLGLSKKQIKELKYEEDRVNKIIELENKNKSK